MPIADDLDMSGWELRKALRLLRKSNPPLLEWLKSPVVYRHDPVFAAEFSALAAEFYSPRRCFIEAELPRLDALNKPDDSAGDVEELNGFFRRYTLAA